MKLLCARQHNCCREGSGWPLEREKVYHPASRKRGYPDLKSYWRLSTWVDKQGDLMLSCSWEGDQDTSGLGSTFEKDRLLEKRSQQTLLRNEVQQVVSKLSVDSNCSPSEGYTSCAEYHPKVIHRESGYILLEAHDAVVAQWPCAASHHSAVHRWRWATGIPWRNQWGPSQQLARTHGASPPSM